MNAAGGDEHERTLAAYERGADRYIERTSTARSGLVDELLALVPAGSVVLELGSGPGRDADALEAAGLVVHRTDGATAFVDRLRAAGHKARVVNVHDDDFGSGYDAIFANAVLLHVRRDELRGVLRTALRAVRPDGILVASFKKGVGEGWSDQKLDDPRHFTYWDVDGLRRSVMDAGWMPLKLEETVAVASNERWITLVVERNERPPKVRRRLTGAERRDLEAWLTALQGLHVAAAEQRVRERGLRPMIHGGRTVPTPELAVRVVWLHVHEDVVERASAPRVRRPLSDQICDM